MIGIANRRKEFFYNLSARLSKEHGVILICHVNAFGLTKTGMAKFVLDASWTSFRNQLWYQDDGASVWLGEVNKPT